MINKFEIKRQILHVLIGIVVLVMIIFELITPILMFWFLMLAGVLAFVSLKWRVPVVSFFLDNFEREDAELPGKGFIMFLAGILLAWKLFPQDIALASIIILVFADPVSHFIGENFGKIPWIDKRKNIEGHLAGFVVSALFAMVFVSPLLAIAGSFGAIVFESLVIEIQKIKIDDNFIIPLVAGTIMLLISGL